MAERSRFWDGIVTGDATEAPYDAPTEFAKVLTSLAHAGGTANIGGVFRGELNELAVTGSATPVAIDTGRAIVWGNWYENDASVTIAIPTPASSTRIDRIVLRKAWAAQTVRITRIAGTEGAGAPSLTQTPGTTWDTPLAQVSITTGGTITVTDERELLGGPAGWLRVGGSASEQSTVSTGSVDLVTIPGLNIPVGTPVRVVFSFRKSAGAASGVSIGTKLNATQVTANATVASNTDRAESGYGEIDFIYGRANYLQSGVLQAWNNLHSTIPVLRVFNADMPTVPLTDIIITGQSGSASVTLAIQDVQVYIGAIQ